VAQADFLPALRFRVLTPLFDPLVRMTTRERTFKQRLLEQAAIRPGERVLDLGCGTGTLAVAIKRACPGARVSGLDADPQILALARRKAASAGTEISFKEGYSNDLPFEEASFDAVVSTLFFHHLTGDVKTATLREVARVLVPGGRLHIGDWGKPSDPLMHVPFLLTRLFDGFDVTAANARGELPVMIGAAGLREAKVERELRAPLGTIALLSAVR
jgi:cyclopropane fatty-acyl-phospholipid synthase-like methyltransferase